MEYHASHYHLRFRQLGNNSHIGTGHYPHNAPHLSLAPFSFVFQMSDLPVSLFSILTLSIYAHALYAFSFFLSLYICSSPQDDPNRGIIPRAVEQIFARSAEMRAQGWSLSCTVSFLEVGEGLSCRLVLVDTSAYCTSAIVLCYCTNVIVLQWLSHSKPVSLSS